MFKKSPKGQNSFKLIEMFTQQVLELMKFKRYSNFNFDTN